MPSLQTNRSLEEGLSQRERGGSRSQDAMTDDRGSGGTLAVPSNEKSISIKELWVVLDMTGKKISFLIDRGATYPVLISHAGPLSSKSCTVNNAKTARDINKLKPKRNPCCNKWPQYIDFDEYSLLLPMLAWSSVSSLAFDD